MSDTDPVVAGEPVMVGIAGSAPRPGLRQAAVDLVLREARRTGKGFRLEDRAYGSANSHRG